MDSSPLMQIPCELRLMIYAYLFDAGEPDPNIPSSAERTGGDREKQQQKKNSAKIISIRHSTTAMHARLECEVCALEVSVPAGRTKVSPTRPARRSKYHVIDRSFNRRCVETTYRLANSGAYFCAALMRVNRRVYGEAAQLVYAGHTFDFGADVEAVKPFLEDLTDDTRALVASIALYKKGPWLYDCWSDRCEWRATCNYLRTHASVKHLRLIVQAGQLAKGREAEVEGPRELTSRDVALLVDIRHDTLHWVGDVVRLKGLEEIEVIPDFCTMPPPQTSNMFVFLAFSASIHTGVKEFLYQRLQLAY
ncbi:hypothetical protein GGR58DRAFT_502552 [Xylaria digitata]|nr:hypothetical protein GGR58DRAFT_502552 [Xylaria digitata]